jgi:heavy metal efflux system protein
MNDEGLGDIETAIGGEAVATLWEGDRRFDVAMRFDRDRIRSPSEVGQLPIYTAQVAQVDVLDGQTTIAREGGRRRLTVRSDIAGRDQGGFVEQAQERLAQAVEVPKGYRVSWLGMFENLQRARRHFATTVIPIAIGLVYVLLRGARARRS